jgi:hypothetical protein
LNLHASRGRCRFETITRYRGKMNTHILADFLFEKAKSLTLESSSALICVHETATNFTTPHASLRPDAQTRSGDENLAQKIEQSQN